MLQIPTKILYLIAAAVWLLAGALVVLTGLDAFEHPWNLTMAIICLCVFLSFFALFIFIAHKQVKRISDYTEKLSPIHIFFDTKSYIIIAVMVFLGIAVRISQLVPDSLIAPFYSGLGAALVLSALYYLVTFIAVCDQFIVADKNRDKQGETKLYGNARYVCNWFALIIVCVVVVFITRVLGYDNSPLKEFFYHPVFPAFMGVLSAMLILFGYFGFIADKSKLNTMHRRNYAMIILMGFVMLGSFFAFKEVMPIVFGELDFWL